MTIQSRMKECGIEDVRAMEMLRERKEKFDKAITEYKTNVNEQQDWNQKIRKVESWNEI